MYQMPIFVLFVSAGVLFDGAFSLELRYYNFFILNRTSSAYKINYEKKNPKKKWN